MEPEDIEGREFFMGLRGYDREEVDAFLAQVAADLRHAKAEIAALRTRVDGGDPYGQVGVDVTAILRTANETAEAIVTTAHEEAAGVRGRAEAAAEQLRGSAEEHAARVRGEANAEAEETHRLLDAAREEASRILADARSAAEQRASAIVTEAEARVPAIEEEAERAGRERAGRVVDDLVARAEEAARQRDTARARLLELSDELQLALMAIDDGAGDPGDLVRTAARGVIEVDGHSHPEHSHPE
jgi:DivIVA domain-containing protein